MLARVRAALPPGGRLVLRVGDAASRRGFAVSRWVDRLVVFVRGHGFAPLAGRTLAAWRARLEALGFAVAERADARRDALRQRPPGRHRPAIADGGDADRMTLATLDHAGVAALIPHRGPMCLLEGMTCVERERDRVRCRQPPRPAPSLAQRERPARERDDRVRGAGDGAARRALRRRRRARRRARISRQRARRPPGLLASRRPAARRSRRARRRCRAPSGRRRADPLRVLASATAAASSPRVGSRSS